MKGQKWLKKIFYLYLIAMQIIALGPCHKALSKPNKKDIWELYLYRDTEDLKTKILQDQKFIKNWAIIAHFLGFTSCGGTKSSLAGDNFSFERVVENDDSGTTHEVYYLKENYNSNDIYAEDYRADERLQMKISNVRLIIDPKTLKIGQVRTIDTKPIMIASAVIENISDKDNYTNISFFYKYNKSWSINNDFGSNENIYIKKNFLASIPLSKNKESTLNVRFSTEQSWKQSNGIDMTERNSIKYYERIQAKSKRQVDLISTLKRSEFPYEGRIYIEYDITFTGFLRDSGNANIDHSTHRTKESITFGGRNGMSATEDLLDMYSNRRIRGYSQWDWKGVITNFGKKNMNSFIKEFCKVKRGGQIMGAFNVFEGTQIELKASDQEHINNTMIKDEDVFKENKVELKSFKSFETPIFDIKGVTLKR